MLEANAQNTVKCKLSLLMALKWVNANFDVLYTLIFDNLKAKIGFNSSSLKKYEKLIKLYDRADIINEIK